MIINDHERRNGNFEAGRTADIWRVRDAPGTTGKLRHIRPVKTPEPKAARSNRALPTINKNKGLESNPSPLFILLFSVYPTVYPTSGRKRESYEPAGLVLITIISLSTRLRSEVKYIDESATEQKY